MYKDFILLNKKILITNGGHGGYPPYMDMSLISGRGVYPPVHSPRRGAIPK